MMDRFRYVGMAWNLISRSLFYALILVPSFVQKLFVLQTSSNKQIQMAVGCQTRNQKCLEHVWKCVPFPGESNEKLTISQTSRYRRRPQYLGGWKSHKTRGRYHTTILTMMTFIAHVRQIKQDDAIKIWWQGRILKRFPQRRIAGGTKKNQR